MRLQTVSSVLLALCIKSTGLDQVRIIRSLSSFSSALSASYARLLRACSSSLQSGLLSPVAISRSAVCSPTTTPPSLRKSTGKVIPGEKSPRMPLQLPPTTTSPANFHPPSLPIKLPTQQPTWLHRIPLPQLPTQGLGGTFPTPEAMAQHTLHLHLRKLQ